MPAPRDERFVIMGVAGAGKTLIGERFARAIGAGFVDGDDFHPPENVAKMAAGVPLTDADRAGWLTTLAARIARARAGGAPLVVACSALKRSYRDTLRSGDPTLRFVLLDGPRDVIARRLSGRHGHFMPAALLDSQFAALERPGADEDVWTCDVRQPPDTIVADLAARGAGR